MVLTVSFVLSPVIGLSCHRHPRKLSSRELDASVEASGPHDFAVRFSAVRQQPLASTASRPASVTCATPLCGMGRGELVEMICPSRPGKNVVFSKLMYDSVYDESRIQDRREP
jgi:hypothetical protein